MDGSEVEYARFIQRLGRPVVLSAKCRLHSNTAEDPPSSLCRLLEPRQLEEYSHVFAQLQHTVHLKPPLQSMRIVALSFQQIELSKSDLQHDWKFQQWGSCIRAYWWPPISIGAKSLQS